MEDITMNKMMKSAVAKRGYFFDMNTDTLYVSKVYEKKRLNYGSAEYKTVLELRKICHELKIEVVSKAYKKPLSYDMMRKFISILPTAEADLKEMERQQKMSVAYKSPYKYMKMWFNEKYPYHKELLVEENGERQWDVIALMRKAEGQKKEKESSKVLTVKSEHQNNIVEMSSAEDVETASEDVAKGA